MKDEFKCNCNIIHTDVVERVRMKMTSDEDMKRAADFFKVMGDPTRMKIIDVLMNAEMCVCDIAHVLDMTQSAISHQLRILKQGNFVKNRRDGKVIYYSLDDEHINSIVELGLVHLRHKAE